MDELRDKVVELVRFSGYPSDDVAAHMHDEAAERTANAILALPEIAEALEALAERRVDAMSPGQFGAAIKNG